MESKLLSLFQFPDLKGGIILDEPIYGIPPDTIVDDQVFALAPANLWHLPRATWDPLWQRVSGKTITVAILDTGIASSHPDLPTPVATKSFISGQSVLDGHGHGTHCAGTAVGRNGLGVAINANLMVGKVLSNSGSGSSRGIANGIGWAADNGADVISMSLGGPSSDSETNAAIDYAVSKGCVVNTAAGNAGYNGANTIGWPGRYPGTLCNAAYQQNGNIAGFSSGGREIDWATPGQDIISASTSGGYRSMSGTSMATPFGSGLIALILELMRREGAPSWNGTDAIRAFLQLWCEDKGPAGRDPRYGWGVPRARDIVASLANDDLKFV